MVSWEQLCLLVSPFWFTFFYHTPLSGLKEQQPIPATFGSHFLYYLSGAFTLFFNAFVLLCTFLLLIHNVNFTLLRPFIFQYFTFFVFLCSSIFHLSTFFYLTFFPSLCTYTFLMQSFLYIIYLMIDLPFEKYIYCIYYILWLILLLFERWSCFFLY